MAMPVSAPGRIVGAWGKTGGGSGVPSVDSFTKPVSGMWGSEGSYTDWNGYNAAIVNYLASQQEGRYQQGLGLMQNVMDLFKDNGAYDQAYQNDKNDYLRGVAGDLVSKGMGNLVNMPAASLAYESKVRPQFEMAKQNRLGQAMTSMAEYTSRYNPSYESLLKPMSVTYAGGGGGGGSRAAGAPALSARNGTLGYPTTDAYNQGVQSNLPNMNQRLDQVKQNGQGQTPQGASPFAGARGSGPASGASPDSMSYIEDGDGNGFYWDGNNLIPAASMGEPSQPENSDAFYED